MEKLLILIIVFCLGIIKAKAQYYDLHNFNDTLGYIPNGAVTLSGSKLFGMTFYGGKNNDGIIFSIDTNGNGFKDLYDFKTITGSEPDGSLTLLGNKLFGMTLSGGAYAAGCIFSIDTNGIGYKDLFDFDGTNGSSPRGSLIYASGNLYGVTSGFPGGYGNIFSIDTNGSDFKDLYDFLSPAAPLGALTLLGNQLYGMASTGTGAFAYGNIFSIDTNGNGFKTVIYFAGNHGIDGSKPEGSLIFIGSRLFGMTYYGGLHDSGCVFSLDTSGLYKDLLDFNGANGSVPYGDLIFTGNRLYGKATRGGANGFGCIFSIDTDGSGYNDIYDFNYASGAYPDGGPLLHSGGDLYGMTQGGGIFGSGVIFKFGQLGLSVNKITETSNRISIFPNPSTGQFTLSLSNVSEKCNVEVYSVLGERVKSEELRAKSEEIDLSSQPNGIYLYRVITENGGLVGEGKLIIQK